jgi:hypothetical protein
MSLADCSCASRDEGNDLREKSIETDEVFEVPSERDAFMLWCIHIPFNRRLQRAGDTGTAPG